MKITVKRSAPEREEIFELPESCREGTVMDALDYISQHLDPTLGYYRHSVCNQGVCGRCMLKVNGKSELACRCRLPDGDCRLEPGNGTVIRDLVVQP